jgi:hypothetical protein
MICEPFYVNLYTDLKLMIKNEKVNIDFDQFSISTALI